MAKRQKFSVPPCSINPRTEQPYKTHKWVIVEDRLTRKRNDPMLYYHVVCARKTCGLNSPNPVRY